MPAPHVIDGYSVVQSLGPGTYGEVFKVLDSKKTAYALKLLRQDAASDGQQRFENEIWALKQISCPNVPTFITDGVFQGRPYFIMSLADGVSLRKISEKQKIEGRPAGSVWTLRLLSALFTTLHNIHRLPILHRDIKDDNIIVADTLSSITLIDFGFCRGAGQPGVGDSFWRVGASRYSPPEKLRHPTNADPSHDVFALGVLAYLLLTNCYPWAVAENEDFGHLEQKMRTTLPPTVLALNNFVPPEVSDFISRLLVISDEHRPHVEEAHAQIEELLKTNKTGGIPVSSLSNRLLLDHVVRDPLHGDIRLTEYEWKLLDSKEYQRLRYIKQLAFANLVYIGADHSRMSHSLGTVFTVDKIMTSIEERQGASFSIDERKIVRCYAMIHDITHICYGHTLEDELGIHQRHDKNIMRFERLLLNERSEVGNILRSSDIGRAALSALDPNTSDTESYLTDLVGGPNGADVLDYIDRDAYFCGLDHRIDSAVYRHFTLSASTGEATRLVSRIFGSHGLRLDAEFALESILLERFSLFLKVYTHITKVAAAAMLGKALTEIRFARGKGSIDEVALEWMGDEELLLRLKASKKPTSAELATALIERRLFKPAFRAQILREGERSIARYSAKRHDLDTRGLLDPAGRANAESELAKQSGIRAADVAVYCTRNAPGFQNIQQIVEAVPGRAEIRDQIHNTYERVVDKHLSLWNIYVFVSRSITKAQRTKITTAAEKLFHYHNDLHLGRRTGQLL